jgi:hypothetical protein
MNVPTKKDEAKQVKVKHPAKPTAEAADPRALHERTMKRYPKTMARLGE